MYLVLQVLATAQALEKAGQQLFRPHGLTVARFNVLNLLSDQPEGVRASNLARALVVDPSNITGLLKRMKAEGLLTELANAHDRRQHVVALSAKGRKAWQAAHRDYERRLEAFESALSMAERKAVEKVLQRMLAESATLPETR